MAGRALGGAIACAAIFAGSIQLCIADGKRPLTVADAIGTTRINQLSLSPDGRRQVTMLVSGDVSRNGVWIELLTSALDSLESAGKVTRIARFFTTALGPERSFDGGASELTFPFFNSIVWLDDHQRVALRIGDGASPIQAVSVDLQTGSVQPLTRSGTDVLSFNADRRGPLVYVARHDHPEDESVRLAQDGFNVTNKDALTLLMGSADGYSLREYQQDIEIFVSPGLGAAAKAVTVNGRTKHRGRPFVAPRFSPSGKQVILVMTPAVVPEEWDRYTGNVLPRILKQWRQDPVSLQGFALHAPFVVDVATGEARALWSAPVIGGRTDVAWAPDGRSILISETYLPAHEADAAGLSGRAVAEVDLATGRFRVLPVPAEFAEQRLTAPQWRGAGIAELTAGEVSLRFRKVRGEWRFDGKSPRASGNEIEGAIVVSIRQDLNTPPRLYATERASQREQMIFDPNPGLTETFSLGRVEHVTWPDTKGRTWSGLLYYPVNYTARRRFPLVLQTHGHAPVTEFSLYGTPIIAGLGPGYAAYAAQPLANLDIAVLQVEDKRGKFMGSPAEAELHAAAFEAAIESLASKGLVDRDRVGILGYSRTGWYVEHALTQSTFPYAAAVLTDVTSCSYMRYTLMPPYCGPEIGAPPFGTHLENWLERSASFNVDRIYAPLRLEETTGPLPTVMSPWELFSRLRELERAVEFHVVPDIAHGSHSVQNPRQSIATKQGAVDWFAFWLADHEDAAPSKVEQYARWRKLRELHRATLAKPRPPLLDWSAAPRAP